MMTMTHAEAYVRTEAGKAEIRAHSIKLSRPARNLLMVIDASCTGDAWIGKVNGSTPGDLDVLLAARLIVPKDGDGGRRWYTSASRWTWPCATGCTRRCCTLLMHEAKERFGLIKGYRLILKIEGCSDLAGMQAVALDFVEQPRKAHGEESAARFRKQLGATQEASRQPGHRRGHARGVAALRPCLDGVRTERRAGLAFDVGPLDGHDVHLVRCGIGKVAAATTTAVLLTPSTPARCCSPALPAAWATACAWATSSSPPRCCSTT